jgi:hypothetical protein
MNADAEQQAAEAQPRVSGLDGAPAPSMDLVHEAGGSVASAEASPRETLVEAHDRHQLEVRFNYTLGREPGPQRYSVDLYFFVPRNVGVSRANYSRDRFYEDANALVRLDAATMPLDRLADDQWHGSPLAKLTQALGDFRSSPRPPPSTPLSVHVKLYAHLFTAGVHDELARLSPDPPGGPAAFERDLLATLARIRAALWAYRRVRAAWWTFESVCHASFAEDLRAADEYVSHALDERLTRFARRVLSKPSLYDGSGAATRCRLAMAALAAEETRYRQRYGYLTLTERDGAGEYFVYRSSLLKKAIQSALYLDMREVEVDPFVRNAVGAVAAALAAIWATALAMKLPAISGLPTGTKLLVFMAAVVAYVLKDRIKAVTNELLVPRLRRYDHTRWLGGEALSAVGLGMLQARLREKTSFVADTDVPAEILALRRMRRTVSNAKPLSEEVIHYGKVLEIGAEDERAKMPQDYWVRDILRLNMRHFLVRLDDPVDKVAYYDHAHERFASAVFSRVYHLNLVLRTRCETAGSVEERLELHRVILNQKGIVRVEAVANNKVRDERRPTGLRLSFRSRRRTGPR